MWVVVGFCRQKSCMHARHTHSYVSVAALHACVTECHPPLGACVCASFTPHACGTAPNLQQGFSLPA